MIPITGIDRLLHGGAHLPVHLELPLGSRGALTRRVDVGIAAATPDSVLGAASAQLVLHGGGSERTVSLAAGETFEAGRTTWRLADVIAGPTRAASGGSGLRVVLERV